MSRQARLVELGRRLRLARERAALTVAELGRRAGVSRRHVTEAEAGRANLSVAKLLALADALEVGPSELLGDTAHAASRRRIALVGLRGAGKSSVGRKLALALETPFFELDQRVEELAGLSLAAIFELHGANGYRTLEAEALERVLAEAERSVIATGGSIVTSPAAFARLRQTCHTVWLRATPHEHHARVLAQGDSRPMRGRPRALDELAAILAEREPLYSRCEIAVQTSGRSPDEIAAELAARFP
jgi:XRE family aerobic/anaerobic benzoate catabolism transcriptional regulator